MLTRDVIARLEAEVAALSKRIEGAADLAALVHRGELPQVTPAAHVVPTGIAAGKVASLTGTYAQNISRHISVVVTFRGRDKVAARGLNGIEALLEAVKMALLGWTPDPASRGVFQLRGEKLLSMAGDALVYQIDFTLPDFMEVTA